MSAIMYSPTSPFEVNAGTNERLRDFWTEVAGERADRAREAGTTAVPLSPLTGDAIAAEVETREYLVASGAAEGRWSSEHFWHAEWLETVSMYRDLHHAHRIRLYGAPK